MRVALSFLTRFPTRTRELKPSDLARAVPWFPVVGALVGAIVAGIYAAGLEVFPPFVAATVAVAGGVLATGAFHEDGLADTADALGGGWSKEEVLGIMKDPAHGTYGVLAILLSVILRVGSIAALDAWAALVALVAAHSLSRGAAIGLMGALAPATEEGLGASYARMVTKRQIGLGIVLALLGAAALGPWAPAAVVCAAAPTVIVGRLASKKIGGITGDVLGAAQQGAEVAVLLLAAGISNGP